MRANEAKKDLIWISQIGLLVKGVLAYQWILVFQGTNWMVHVVTDLWSWLPFFQKTAAGQIPYVDFTREYPVGAGLLYWVLGLIFPSEELGQVVTWHVLLGSALDIANALLIYSIAREFFGDRRKARLVAFLFLLNPTSLMLSPFRFENVITVFVLLGYRAFLRKQYDRSTVWWTLGASLKWFPMFFIAAQELQRLATSKEKWKWVRSGFIFAGISLLIHGPFLLWSLLKHGNIEAWWGTYFFHLNRPLYWDTLLGVLIIWFGYLPWEQWASRWTAALVGGALFFKPRKISFEVRVILMCIAAIIFNRVYSTQFHLWFYPFLFFIMVGQAGEDLRKWKVMLAAFLIFDLVNVLVFPFSFAFTLMEIREFGGGAAVALGGPWTVVFSTAIVLRTIGLGLLAFWLGRTSLVRNSPPGEN